MPVQTFSKLAHTVLCAMCIQCVCVCVYCMHIILYVLTQKKFWTNIENKHHLKNPHHCAFKLCRVEGCVKGDSVGCLKKLQHSSAFLSIVHDNEMVRHLMASWQKSWCHYPYANLLSAVHWSHKTLDILFLVSGSFQEKKLFNRRMAFSS